MNQLKIAPSILSKLNELDETITILNSLPIEAIHMDVMDGKFVKNKTFDYTLIERIKTPKIIDTHLMIEKPLDVIDRYLACSDIVTFHLEAVNGDELSAFLKNKPLNKKIGLSIKPQTNVLDLVPYLNSIDLVLVMTVEPGQGGQAFMMDMLPKIKFLSDYKAKNNLDYLIEVDGGINSENVQLLKANGAEMIVVGTFFFKNDNYLLTIDSLR